MAVSPSQRPTIKPQVQVSGSPQDATVIFWLGLPKSWLGDDDREEPPPPPPPTLDTTTRPIDREPGDGERVASDLVWLAVGVEIPKKKPNRPRSQRSGAGDSVREER